MKVCHVIETLGRGGAEQLLATLLPELKRQSVEPVLCVLRPPMDLAPAFEEAGIPIHQLPSGHRWNLPRTARAIARVVRQEKAEIVHAHLYFPSVAAALLRSLRLAPVKTCVTFHNLAFSGANKAGAKLTFRRRLASLLYRSGMDRFFGASQAVVDHYADAHGLPQFDVMYNPVDIAGLSHYAKPLRDASGAACHIVLPGRIVHEKGHSNMIVALQLLKARGAPLPQLTIAGDGRLRARVAQQVNDAGLSDFVRFTGELPHGELMVLVGTADIVAVPSLFEGFGLTAAEAMALGRPVIASAVGGLPEVLGGTGLLVAPADPEALAHGLSRLLGDPALRARLGTAAAIRAQETFDLPTIARRHKDAYEEMTRGKSL